MQSNVSFKDGHSTVSEVSKKVKNPRQNEAARKLKPSLIPMLKSSTRKVPTKEVSKSSTKGVSKKSHFEHNNVQRVQRLNIDHDTCPGITSPSKLVTTARPIPTLQHIYGQDLSNETFADWMLETVSEYQDAPENLADSTSEEAQKVVSDCRISMNNANNEVNNLSDSLFVEPELLNNKPTGSFKSTNENVQDWLSTKLECPTRDNECDVFLGDKPTVVINRAKVKSLPINKKKAGIPKLNTEIKLVTKQTDIQIPFKYQSYSNPLRNMEYNERKTSSYVECPSEILQKTTNFDANVTDSFIDWSRLQKSHENTTNGKSSKTSLLTSERWQLSFSDNKDEQYSIKSPDKNSYHDYYHHYCWRKEVAKKRKAIQDLWDWKGRCTKCQRHRISPYQKKIADTNVQLIILRSFTISSVPRSLKNLKRRMSIGRIVRRRWNCVWKKTAERWSNWSKPPYKFRKFRSVNLKKNSKWDDAVQTAIFVYNETGSSVRSTSFDKSYLRHANVGPSMFRFQQPSKFAGYSPSQSKATSYKSMRSYCYSFDTKSNECTFPYRIPDKFKNVESKNLSAIVEPSLIKSVDEEPKDAYTQMLITCNNAETNVKLTSDMVRDLFKVETCDDFVSSSGVDEGIQTLISSKSQRSIKTMTSMNDLQRFLHKEIQASPVPSIRKVSTFFGDDEQLEDAKSSVVTDTSLPYRRLNNKILTAKGTILTCTGTKITSVSSVHIQTASVISRTPKITMSTAVSTHLSTENRDCWTAPSFHLSNVEDVSMGTDDPEVNRSEKSTSYAQFTDYINAGISTSNLVQRISFNDGPHYTQDNFEAEAYPECSSICVNTDVETKPMSIETGSSLEFTNEMSKIDRYSQYSERSSNNQSSNSSANSARIGQSRLLSVRNFGESLYIPPQQTVCSSLDKKMIMPQQRDLLASQTTSIDAISIHQPSNNMQANPDTGNIVDHSKTSCNDTKSMIESNSNGIPSSTEPNTVTSNLNAAKWMKGYVNDSKKDVQSVINLSESTVNESLERASFAISNSDVKKTLDLKKVSNNVNQKGTVNSVPAKPLGLVSTLSVPEICPTKDNTKSNEKPITANKPSDSRKNVVDQIISGQVFPSDVTESVQVRPQVHDAATGNYSLQICYSNFAGSSHILPKLLPHCDGNVNTDDEVTELLKEMTSQMTSCMLSANAECCPECNRPATTDISIQAVVEYLNCPKCTSRIADTLVNNQDTIGGQNWQVAADSRYFSNLLAMKIAVFKDYFQRCIAPSFDATVYQKPTTPNIYTEACTMKPSGRQDEYCQTKISGINTKKKVKRSCYISPTCSLIDIRGKQETDDLRAVYNILTAIEGRVRRIKNYMHT